MKSDIAFFSMVVILSLTEIAAYDLGSIRSTNSCKEDITLRDIQIRSMVAVEKKLKYHGYKFNE